MSDRIYNKTAEDLELLAENLEYNPVLWEDRVEEFPNTWDEKDIGNGSIHHQRAGGKVEIAGTPRNAKNLGNMDLGIYLLFMLAKKAREERESLQLQITNLHNAVFNNLTDNIFKFSFTNLEHIEIVDGWYDEIRKEVRV